jgi:hypothetical protein
MGQKKVQKKSLWCCPHKLEKKGGSKTGPQVQSTLKKEVKKKSQNTKIFIYPKEFKKKKSAPKVPQLCPNTTKREKSQIRKRKLHFIPYFRLWYPVFDFDPSFSDITKIRKEGTKSKKGTGLGTELERSLRKTWVSMEQKVDNFKYHGDVNNSLFVWYYFILVLIALGSIFIFKIDTRALSIQVWYLKKSFT